MNLVMLYIPVPDVETGRRLADAAVQNRWAACANLLGPLESTYEWEGKLCREEERLLLLKTTGERAEETVKEIEALHPYDCPCILKLPVEANAAFSAWVNDTVN